MFELITVMYPEYKLLIYVVGSAQFSILILYRMTFAPPSTTCLFRFQNPTPAFIISPKSK